MHDHRMRRSPLQSKAGRMGGYRTTRRMERNQTSVPVADPNGGVRVAQKSTGRHVGTGALQLLAVSAKYSGGDGPVEFATENPSLC